MSKCDHSSHDSEKLFWLDGLSHPLKSLMRTTAHVWKGLVITRLRFTLKCAFMMGLTLLLLFLPVKMYYRMNGGLIGSSDLVFLVASCLFSCENMKAFIPQLSKFITTLASYLGENVSSKNNLFALCLKLTPHFTRHIKWIAQHFGKYAYYLSCRDLALDERLGIKTKST